MPQLIHYFSLLYENKYLPNTLTITYKNEVKVLTYVDYKLT